MKGKRGIGSHNKNPFDKHTYEPNHNEWFDIQDDHEERTQVLEVYPKTILNRVKSPDVPGEWSMNPYQGCEHGCSYCYARHTHEYWGYNSGLAFEQKILVKKNAPELLRSTFHKKSWKGEKILLSGNTDCYQPQEKKQGITRELLNICNQYNNPVGIITKNSLIIRDLDIIEEMASKGMVQVAISITTMMEDLRRRLEPRTSTIVQRFRAVSALSKLGVPVTVMMAPVIPSLNDHEILEIARKASESGANSISYSILRLNNGLEMGFDGWLKSNYPERRERVMNQVFELHGGKPGETEFYLRMKGQGSWSKIIKQQFQLAKAKYFQTEKEGSPILEQFKRPSSQLDLF